MVHIWRRVGSVALGGVLAVGLSLGGIEVVEPAVAVESELGSTLSSRLSASSRRKGLLSNLREKALEQARKNVM